MRGLFGGSGAAAGATADVALAEELLVATIRQAVQDETRMIMYIMLALAGMVAAMAVFLVSFAARCLRTPAVPAHGALESSPASHSAAAGAPPRDGILQASLEKHCAALLDDPCT
jgi:hypothetical protein